MKRAYKILGFSFILIGFISIINSIFGLTGFVIANEVNRPLRSMIEIWFIAEGFAFLYAARKRRGQAAMEFLMTYGWAILAAIMALGVIAYFGVFNPGKYFGSNALLSPPFNVKGWDVSPNEIKLELINNGGKAIQSKV